MEKQLLLPGNWLHLTPNSGLNPVDPNDFESRLYQSDEIDHPGVPSIFARAFSFTKALQTVPQEAEAFEFFCRLVQAIFLGIVRITPYKLSTATRLTKVIQAFEPTLEVFCVLKWNDRVVGGIYPDCFVFPSAKFQTASECRDVQQGRSPEPDYIDVRDGKLTANITLGALGQAVDTEIERVGPDLVKALFLQWIEQIRQALALRPGISITALHALDSMANSVWATHLRAPAGSIERFTVDEGAIPLRNDAGQLVQIPVRRLNVELFCERLVICSDGRAPQLPIKAKHLPLIDVSKTRIARAYQGLPVYEVQLHGWDGPITWKPLSDATIENFEGSILLWPNFKASGWYVNYAYFLTTPEFAADDPAINLLSSDFRAIDTIPESQGCRTRQEIDYIEITLGGKSAGIFSDGRSEIGAGKVSKTISLDFGTSNTSLGIFDEHTHQYVVFELEDLCYDVLTGLWWRSEGDPKRDASSFVPTASMGTDNRLAFLPSEILFNTEAVRAQGNLTRPITDFTIPFPYYRRSGVRKLLISDFKWNAPEGFDRDDLIKAYLKIVLHLVLAQIRKEHLCTQVAVVPTYPLAFGPGRYEDYKTSLAGGRADQSVFSELRQETGITVSLAMVNPALGLQELIAESYAVEAFSFAATRPDTALMVVDIGGGTTDIAVRVREKEYVDSLSYGGNVYLAYLAQSFPSYPQKDSGEPYEDLNERLIVLQKLVRERGGIRAVFHNYPTQQQRAAQAGIDRFLIGLFVYLERLLASQNIRKVDFFPVGNGWRLIEGYTPPHDTIPEYIRDLFKRWDVDATVVLPPDNDFKGAVSKGAIRIARDGTYIHPEEIAVRTIVGGDLQVSGRQVAWTEEVPTRGLSEEPLSFETSEFIKQFVKLSGLPLSEKQQKEIERDLTKECQNCVYTAPGLRFGLSKSVISIFLEKIYTRLFMSVRGAPRSG